MRAIIIDRTDSSSYVGSQKRGSHVFFLPDEGANNTGSFTRQNT